LPWSGDARPYGFSPNGNPDTWLDQPDDWARLTVAFQSGDTGSMLALYREGLRLRREAPWSSDDVIRWLDSSASVLAFARGEGFACFVNFGPEAVQLPPGAVVLLASDELEGGALPQDTTVWLSQAGLDTASDRSRKEGP
jgi:alpha-glucosidase